MLIREQDSALNKLKMSMAGFNISQNLALLFSYAPW